MATIQSSIQLYDSFSPVLYNIMDAVNLTITSVEHMQQSLGADIDMSSLNGAVDSIHEAEAALLHLNEQLRNGAGGNDNPIIDTPPVPPTPPQPPIPPVPPTPPVPPPHAPVEVPVHWRTDNMQIFTNTGVDRFQQEVQSANSMLEALHQTQLQITASSGNTDIFPPDMAADMSNMQNRLREVQNRIQAIESNPVNLGSDAANAELEHLRMQLANAMNAQNDLNNAVQRMDVNAANQAYLRLSGTIGNVERELRDNVDEQGRLNQQIREGTTASNGLLNSIKRIATAYIGIQSAAKVINLSDTMAQSEARLSLIVDDGGSVEALQQQIFASAQEARSSYQDTVSVVAKLGLQAQKAFSGTDEIIAFSELMSKNFKIAGASTQEQTAAMYQLTQAMSAGKLQGDEYRSIIENAPLLANAIEDYMVNVQQAEGSMKEWASEGMLTADVIKAALFTSADEINERFADMPMTFAEIGTSIKNQAIMAFEPVLQRLNDIANSDRFQSMVDGVIAGLVVISNVATGVFDLLVSGAAFVYDNWDLIGPLFYAIAGALGVYTAAVVAHNIAQGIHAAVTAASTLAGAAHSAALMMQSGATFSATVAQYGLNAALLACPITWVVIGILAIVAAIGIVTAIINRVCDVSISAVGMIVGTVYYLAGAVANCGLVIANIGLGIWEIMKLVAENIQIAFENSINQVKGTFYGLAATALTVVAVIADALSQLPFIEFDAAGLSSAAAQYASDYATKSQEAFGNIKGHNLDIAGAWEKGSGTYGLDDFLDLDAEFDRGYEWGAGLQDKISGALDLGGVESTFDPSSFLNGMEDAMGNVADNTGATAGNTADIADALEITDEDLKYLRDIAEREVIDRTVLKEVKIDMSGMVNKVENLADLDGISTYLTRSLKQQMAVSMEG